MTSFLEKKPKKDWTLTPKSISYGHILFNTPPNMPRLTERHAREILKHIEYINAVLELYKKEVEPYDQLDRLHGKTMEIEAILAE